MDITPLGHSSFKMKGKKATVITDPYDSEMVGLNFPKHTEADVVTISHEHPDHNVYSQIDGTPFIIRGPGEYEVMGVGIVGFSSYHDDKKGQDRGNNTIYRIEIDGISIVHLGDLGHTLPSALVDDLGNVDILCVPVGGTYTIDPTQAVTIINEVEPSVVIPMHYATGSHNPKEFGTLSNLAQFLKEIGKAETVPQSKYSVTREKLPEQMQVVVLE